MKMIQETVGSTPSAMQQCDYRQLAHETEKLADNAIRSAIREAFKKPLSRIIRATHYKPVSPFFSYYILEYMVAHVTVYYLYRSVSMG